MNKKETISLKEARTLALQSQGFFKNNFGKEKKATLNIIEHLGYVQIDTISVIARAHHHTLWTRLPDYQEKYLNELLEKDKSIFEYWSHAASYLPMKDYRFSLPMKKNYAEGKSHWFKQDLKMNEIVLDRIKSEGALQSKDFEHTKQSSGWYDWKPAKKSLEQLFMQGKLMIAKRKGFQKVYDLPERVLPTNIDTTFPTTEEYIEYLINTAIKAHGLVNISEIVYLRTKLKDSVNKVLKKMLIEGKIKEVYIEGIEKEVFFTIQEKLDGLSKFKIEKQIHFLSPFDNTIIQRKRVQKLFNFDYLIECYLPENKRKYGYFCLPILYGDKLVGRFDPKADRTNKVFYVKELHFENDFKPDDKFNTLFLEKLKQFAEFNGCKEVVFQNSF